MTTTAAADRQTLLILGASGDLTARLLLPGLGRLVATGGPAGLTLLGSGTEDWDDDRWRKRITESFGTVDATGDRVTEVVRSARYLQANVTRAEDLRRLLDACQGPVAIFFALPPPVTARACARARRDRAAARARGWCWRSRSAPTRPSARALNALLAELVPEDQIHRVDHFLGKSTVLNILGLRFANRIFEPVLQRRARRRASTSSSTRRSGSRAGPATTTAPAR